MNNLNSLILVLSLLLAGCHSRNEKAPAPNREGSAQSSTINNLTMKRYCLAFDLRNDPEKIKQYKYVHTKEGIWPEIPRGIKEVGITDMEIWLWQTRMFMILEAPAGWDYDSQMAKMGTLEKQKEWGEYVGQFQQLLPYSKNGETWMHMENVFQLNPAGLKESPETGYTEQVSDVPSRRFCATLDLKDNPDLISQYRYHHSPEAHWKEIANGIREVGILDMQIYLIGTRMFMIAQTTPDFQWDQQMERLSALDKQAEWAALMKNYQQALPGLEEVKWELMEKVFDLDRDF